MMPQESKQMKINPTIRLKNPVTTNILAAINKKRRRLKTVALPRVKPIQNVDNVRDGVNRLKRRAHGLNGCFCPLILCLRVYWHQCQYFLHFLNLNRRNG
jgi:hypothetical protein